MEASLRVIAGSFPSASVEIPPGKLVFGRAEDCDVRVKSEFVSGRHCALLLDEHTLRIRDLGSKNGTLVNGRRIGTTPLILQHADIVAIGDIYFLVDLKHAKTTGGQQPAPSGGVHSALQATDVFSADTVQDNRPESLPLQPAPPPQIPEAESQNSGAE
jgi:predicted component of type VI protein secretion system